MNRARFISFAAVTVLAVSTTVARAQIGDYYIGRDSRTTIPSGTYAGLVNPNRDRITFLYAHTFTDTPSSNHYHGKGVYSYTGPNLGTNTAVNPFNASNFLPEPSGGTHIPLLPGSGVFAGSYISGLTPGQSFTNMRIRSVDSLAGHPPGSPEQILFNSSGDRWSGSMAGSQLTLELLAISPGLTIADTAGTTVMSNVGDLFALGNGSTFDFTPVFVADGSLSPNTGLSARFRILDTGIGNLGQPWGQSGEFVFNVATVPEPSSWALAAVAVGAGAWSRLRRRAMA